MADQQKTEQPTQRRMKKARDEGNFPTARVFVNALQFIVFVWMLKSWGPAWVQDLRASMASLLEHALDPRMSTSEVVALGLDLLRRMITPLGMLGAAMVGITLAIQFGVTHMGVSLKKLAPDLNRLNPASRLKELPKQNLPSLLQACVMIPAFGGAVYYLVTDNLGVFMSLPLRSVPDGLTVVAGSIQTLLWKAALVFMIFGAVDLLRQKRRYSNDLKMSKQDIRDEYKEVEGNPFMKQRIRRIRRDLARRHMMKAVPTATAVIVNPTHYAVAIKYSMDSKGAPMVVAKGKNYLALRIRKMATENQVPLIENPPLAQALYKSVDVGQEIPAQFYRAVAEVLAYIFKLMNGRRVA